MVRVKTLVVRKGAWFSKARPWRGFCACRPCAMAVPRHGEGVRCGRGGFFKRSQRSEALKCSHTFANTKKAPLQRIFEPSEHGVRPQRGSMDPKPVDR